MNEHGIILGSLAIKSGEFFAVQWHPECSDGYAKACFFDHVLGEERVLGVPTSLSWHNLFFGPIVLDCYWANVAFGGDCGVFFLDAARIPIVSCSVGFFAAASFMAGRIDAVVGLQLPK